MDIAQCILLHRHNRPLGCRWRYAWIDLRFYLVCLFLLLLLSALTYEVRAVKGHTGVYLVARISKCLHDYGIDKKVP